MKKFSLLLLPLLLSGCFSSPAIEVSNICTLMDEEVTWYQGVKASEKKYGAPAYVQLAIIYQESRFQSDAKPPRGKLFGVIPWARPSSSKGFAQATEGTWDWYQKSTKNYNRSRTNFVDAADFVGWYISQSNKRSGVSKTDAFNQYLAYHEGHGGFNRKTHLRKNWLIGVAKKVENNAKRYKKQLKQCRARLDKNRAWSFF
ncbi:transglycosylase SLT domain-containing protein [Bathymodiolus septemdierum thioautotrophic gill symbiont]|uniref:Transglycosylase SLT domain-containing protein n=1 Tax=endosymbiont of Bathymodiolus septemdierum str. Myojin knoll TaxID=1303921 RepID=A0A0P0UR95_9GAMM|nr:transglycosylase SLT domain-containing protein [Bathymodiolus septemdierum thioautotrophic gill symbiont]BAS67474.1 conserved hypothetical protein [endosymbiont of Bathymodiolus septemdierum str. Myojin knoll]